MLSIVDAGPLFGALDPKDPDHAQSREILERPDLQLVIPALVVAEASYLAQRRIGPHAERLLFAGLADMDVVAPSPEDFLRMAELVERHADWPLGGCDASVLALAERLGTTTVITFDHRHFGALRTAAGEPLTLLPDPADLTDR
ncbi:MAG TPA: PIN domain-containing protein [Solirubrobacteraceae bacterium]|nr:PIN domain-containing protein [Solirubrobacteraceae bacterium]